MPKHSNSKPLGDHAKRYLDLLGSLGRALKQPVGALRLLERWLLENGVHEIGQISPEHLGRWRLEMAARLHPRTVQARTGHIRRFFLHLYSRGILSSNPTRLLPHDHVPRPSSFVFTLEEIRRILTEGLRTFEVPFVRITAYTLFHLFYATGMRRSEALNLEVADLDLGGQKLHIRRTKFHKERVIPIGKRVTENLRAYLRARCRRNGLVHAHDPVFAAPRHRRPPPGPMDGAVAWHLFNDMLLAVGLRSADRPNRVGSAEKPRIHTLRHAFAVHRLIKWYREGADLTHKLFLLSAYMGHRGPDETAVYLHATEALLALAKGRLDQYLLPVK
jgi:site-specific recombinase XerD